MNFRFPLLGLMAVGLCACPNPSTTSDPPQSDAGTATTDAGPQDAAVVLQDAGVDAAVAPDSGAGDAGVSADAAVGRDAAVEMDAAVPDAAVPDAAVPDAAVPDAAVADAGTPDAAVPCPEGQGCGSDGVCAGGRCCPAVQACGTACCDTGDVCSFGVCTTPGPTCAGNAGCAVGEYCDPINGVTTMCGALETSTGVCLPQAPACMGIPINCLDGCTFTPSSALNDVVLKYAWGNAAAVNTQDSVITTPVVIQLDDDNCDGLVNHLDIPEIVFSTFASGGYSTGGTLRVISIVNGAVVDKWSSTPTTPPLYGAGGIAAGDIHPSPGNEIVTCTTTGAARVYAASGTQLWLSNPGTCSIPSLADVDGNGSVEVVTESAVYEGQTGAVAYVLSPGNTNNVVAHNLDGMAGMELVTPHAVYDGTGARIAQTMIPARYVAVADLDGDGQVEIASADFQNHRLVLWRFAPSMTNGVNILRQVDINGALSPAGCSPSSVGNTRGGGPPLLADLDGDGILDVGIAGGLSYNVFSGAALLDTLVPAASAMLWQQQTQDCSSASTGSAAFDLNGDGAAEVLYGDEVTFRVLNGATGDVLFSTCNTNGTLFESASVADVDGDGMADVVVPSNSYSAFQCAGGLKTAGVRVFSAGTSTWARAPRIWNQHGYDPALVTEDGAIRTVALPSRGFRAQPASNQTFRVDVTVRPHCGSPYGLRATVRNMGDALAPAGVGVRLHAGDPGAGGTELTTVPLLTTMALESMQAMELELDVASPPAGLLSGTLPVFAEVTAPGVYPQCRPDSVYLAGTGACAP